MYYCTTKNILFKFTGSCVHYISFFFMIWGFDFLNQVGRMPGLLKLFSEKCVCVVCVCVHACVRAYMHAFLRAFVRACVRVYLSTYVCAYAPT